jgi:hypothetical protein
MADQKLIDEIQKELDAGLSNDLIKAKLNKKGWDNEDITGALAVTRIHRISSSIPGQIYKPIVSKPKRTSKGFYVFLIIVLLIIGLLLLLNRIGTRSGVTDAQVQEALPGDSIFPQPWISIDRAATLPVSAQDALPWVVQLGKDRAGWYAPMWLEDALKDHSATTTLPQFQNLTVGEVVPDWGGGSLQVLQVVPDQYVVYGSIGHDAGMGSGTSNGTSTASTTPHYNFTWALVLEHDTPNSTSFHLRLRIPKPTSGLAQYIPPSLPGLIDYATDEVMFAGLKEKL